LIDDVNFRLAPDNSQNRDFFPVRTQIGGLGVDIVETRVMGPPFTPDPFALPLDPTTMHVLGVPEPSSILLVGIGTLGIVGVSYRRRRRNREA
jgi:hypothetical protein